MAPKAWGHVYAHSRGVRMFAFRRLAVPVTSIALALTSCVWGVASPAPASAWCWDQYKFAQGNPHEIAVGAGFQAGFVGAVKNAILGWNNVTNSTWRAVYVAPGYSGGLTAGGRVIMGNAPGGFPAGVPGATQTVVNANGVITSGNTWLNPAFTWNAAGVMNQAQSKADITTVALHEIGHWFELLHPSACGAMNADEVASVMNPNWQKKWTINADDKAGAAAIY
jgi:hypothetical protein